MKKFIFIVIFYLTAISFCFSQKNNSAFKTELFSETDTKELSAGIKFTSRNFNAVLGARDFDLTAKKFPSDKENLNIAAQMGSVFYAGRLSFADSISRLKNPQLYVSSPLKNSVWFTPGLKCSLPQYNGSPKPVSAALIFPHAEFAATEEKDFFASLHTSLPLPVKKSSINFTGGIFNHKKDFKTSWFNQNKWYKEAGYLSFSTEFNMHSDFFETSVLCGASENPFGGFFFYAASHNSLIAGPFKLNFAFYQGDENLITAEGTQIETKRQLEFNPQFIYRFKKVLIKTGVLFHGKIKNQKNEYFFKGGILFQTPSFQSTASASCSYKTEDGFFEYGANLSIIKKTKSLWWNSKLAYKNENLIKNTYSLSQILKINCFLKPEFSLSCTTTERSGELKHRFSAYASIQEKTRNLTANFRITYVFVAIP